jgi:hypothetical protein
LKHLTDLTGKGAWKWQPKHEHAFKEMKALATADVLMSYPDHNYPFEIYNASSDYQIGTCIMQNGKPAAYYSRKLNKAQQNYSTMEKEF